MPISSGRGLRLRDRFFRAPVARAITSPAGIVSGSLAAAVLLGAGAPLAAALLAAVGAWAVPVGRAMARVPGFTTASRTMRSEIRGKWKAAVVDAEDAAARFQRAIEGARRGPLRDRLVELEEDVLQSLDSCRDLAAWGADAESARRELDPRAMERVADRAGKPARDAALSQRQLIAQLREVEREARARLVLINGRLDEAVGRAVE
ncbi:MAG: hypothetical protein KY454_08455, partial [Actinobacteria bacterium]|nr:hypothetical protein [Actinomycetota bacterium]